MLLSSAPSELPAGVTLDANWRDADLRPALRAILQEGAAEGDESVLYEELCVKRGDARVDLVMVNGALHGYEIKSARDTVRRLERQSRHYSAALERVTVVCASDHLPSVEAIVPVWWELVEVLVTAEATLMRTARPGRANPEIDCGALAELLWRDELIAALRAVGADRGNASAPKRVLRERLCGVLEAPAIAAVVRAALKSRSRGSTTPQSS